MSYLNSWEPKGLHRKFTGHVNGDDILKLNLELHVDPKFQSIKYIINDFTEMEDHSIEIAHVDVYAQTDEIISYTKGKLKISLVVIQPDHVELAQYYCDQMEGKLFECKIFKSVKGARKWVNIE